MEVPHCVVVLNGMAFETILSRGNGLLIGKFTNRLICIFSDIDMVIICINCLYHILDPKMSLMVIPSLCIIVIVYL